MSISYTNNDTVFGSTLTFDCESGFMLNGSASSTCQADGLWDVQTFPVCQEGSYLNTATNLLFLGELVFYATFQPFSVIYVYGDQFSVGVTDCSWD